MVSYGVNEVSVLLEVLSRFGGMAGWINHKVTTKELSEVIDVSVPLLLQIRNLSCQSLMVG